MSTPAPTQACPSPTSASGTADSANPPDIAAILDALAAGANERDRTASGLGPALSALSDAGLLVWNAIPGPERPPAAQELALVRRVARADGSLGRVFDGHLNAVERLAVQAPPELAAAELAEVRAGRLRAGVWGGAPRPGEGEPARVVLGPSGGDEVLDGVMTFCSGAGCLDRALVLAAHPGTQGGEAPVAVWIDVGDSATVSVDETWYLSSGLRASASHRVCFNQAPVLARFGGPGAITVQPWFARDALRTAASWAGMADRAAEAALGELARRPGRGQLESLAAGRILAAGQAIDAELAYAATAMDSPDRGPALTSVSVSVRAAVAAAVGRILTEAARACGSHPFATGGDLDRTRRDLELFLLQHRLDPALARIGETALEAIATGAHRDRGWDRR